jgi:hypothetical protein
MSTRIASSASRISLKIRRPYCQNYTRCQNRTSWSFPPAYYLSITHTPDFAHNCHSHSNLLPNKIPHTSSFRCLKIVHQTSVSLLQKPPESLATPFYPAPTVCRHRLLLLINSAPSLLIISSHQFSWTTQHTLANTKQTMQLHVVVNGAP